MKYFKRFLALLLLLAMLPALPALADEDERAAYLVKETWQAGNGDELKFKKDGTGTITINGKTMKGEWMLDYSTLQFSYVLYGEQVWKASFYSMDDDKDNYYIRAYDTSEVYWHTSVLDGMKAKANKNRYTLKLKEEVPLDFLTFQINDAFVGHAYKDALKNYTLTMDAEAGYEYLFVKGTVTNPGDRDLWLKSYSLAEVLLDGKTAYPAEMLSTEDGKNYTSVKGGKTQELYFCAKIPASALKKAKTAVLDFCFYNGMRSTPKYGFLGDFFFRVKLSEKKLTAIKKGQARKTTYFKENKQVPNPASLFDLIQSGSPYEYKHSKLSANKKAVAYEFRIKYSDGNARKLFSSYGTALKDAGFTLTKIKTYASNGTCYYVKSGKKIVASIRFPATETSKYFYVYVLK